MSIVQRIEGGVRLTVRVQPRAQHSSLAGLYQEPHGEALKVRVAAPPIAGAANEELIRFLAQLLEVPRSRVALVSGASSRRKVVEVTGVSEAEARERLGLPG